MTRKKATQKSVATRRKIILGSALLLLGGWFASDVVVNGVGFSWPGGEDMSAPVEKIASRDPSGGPRVRPDADEQKASVNPLAGIFLASLSETEIGRASCRE